MFLRGIRGAIVCQANTKEDILAETQLLLEEMIAKNGLEVPDIASIFFSITQDLNAEFPALAARKMGWVDTPLLCFNEISVPGSLEKCIRVLVHVNTEKAQPDMVPVYLKDASRLRPDQAAKQSVHA